jgi:hypothetical protein
MWLLRFIITVRNNKGLIKRGEIRTNSRCWPKLSGKTPQLPTHKARENPECLPAHVFSVALRDTGPVPILRYTAHQDHVIKCKQEGHWVRDCPSTPQGGGGV